MKSVNGVSDVTVNNTREVYFLVAISGEFKLLHNYPDEYDMRSFLMYTKRDESTLVISIEKYVIAGNGVQELTNDDLREMYNHNILSSCKERGFVCESSYELKYI